MESAIMHIRKCVMATPTMSDRDAVFLFKHNLKRRKDQRMKPESPRDRMKRQHEERMKLARQSLRSTVSPIAE